MTRKKTDPMARLSPSDRTVAQRTMETSSSSDNHPTGKPMNTKWATVGGTVVELEGWYYVGRAGSGRKNSRHTHWINARTKSASCGLRMVGYYSADITQRARGGNGLGSLVSCKHCNGSHDNLGKLN